MGFVFWGRHKLREARKKVSLRRLGERGQATTEYILILAVAVAIAVAVSRGVVGALDDSIYRFGGKLEKQLKTGRVSPSVYRN